MAFSPQDLQPAPPGFQCFAWRGIALLLPDDWNLRLHHVRDRSGALVFADLQSPRLELRWRSLPRIPLFRATPASILERNIQKIKKRHPNARIQSLSRPPISSFTIHYSPFTIHHSLLAADAHHLYELHCPAAAAPSENFFDSIAADFLHHLPLASAPAERFWSIYGATGWVPAHAQLQKISLLPGAATLTFKHRRGALTLGSFSMADRLLAQGEPGSLRHWAANSFPLIARLPKGRWQESPDETLFTAPARRGLRPYHHLVKLHHDLPSNRITWSHHFAPGNAPVPSEP